MKAREYHSRLAGYIDGLITEKRACGYSYEFEAYILEDFDRFTMNSAHDDGRLSRELVTAWAEQRPTEGKGYRNQRVSFVKQLALYMMSLGLDSYVPNCTMKAWTPDPYILSAEELSDFFCVVDRFRHPQKSLWWLSPTYSVLFRLYCCCGLRLNEGIMLRRSDMDLHGGVILVRHSKGDKDRAVFMSDDLLEMCRRYDAIMDSILPKREWFFPGRAPSKPLYKTSLDQRFRKFWETTQSQVSSGKRPTIHSLRHTYVVTCMNKWMAEGRDIQCMMPYLSRQLGHSSVNGTQYYFHTSMASLPIVRGLDKSAGSVIPNASCLTECANDAANSRQTAKGRCDAKAKDSTTTANKDSKTADRVIPEVKRYEG